METSTGDKPHRFGGDWTEAKLEVIARYLRAYTTALHDKPTRQSPFRKAYIDAFAGSGYREAPGSGVDSGQDTLFLDLTAPEPQGLLDGSARIALKVEPSFDRYLFIEQRQQRCAEFEALKTEFPELADRIEVRRSDANDAIQELCRPGKSWTSHRAVLFLDPYGMQVEWETIEAVAATRAIDTWILFPLGIGVNRLLTRSGDIPAPWRSRLDRLLGTTKWFDEFYEVQAEPTLFGGESATVKRATFDSIGRFFVERLETVFCAVAERPRVLCNSSRSPLYLLCFAAGNQRGAPIASRFANHLLKSEGE